MKVLDRSLARKSRGFTLVEVLVALVVLSIGLLGVAALQLTSLRSNHGSAMRSQATFLAYDIIDRMRANQSNSDADKNRYVVSLTGNGTAGTVHGNDIIAWKQNIARTLPAFIEGGASKPANGSVARNGNIFTVTIKWGDWDDSGATGRPPLEFTMDTQLLK